MEETVLDILAQVCDRSDIREQPDIELLDSGLMDSLAFIGLLTELEEKLGIELQPTQLSREVWRTPASILQAVYVAVGDAP